MTDLNIGLFFPLPSNVMQSRPITQMFHVFSWRPQAEPRHSEASGGHSHARWINPTESTDFFEKLPTV